MIHTNSVRLDAPAIRELARRGELARTVTDATGPERRRLTGAVYEVVWPLVFTRLTRRLELQRGHRACAASLRGLADECFDRFQDDLEAVVGDVMRRATVPIENLDAWVCSRLNAATVDAHRRRRGERGALQRPRLPTWLREALHDDRWLATLAIEMLVWVGVPTTAGAGVWPLDSWAHRRAVFTQDWHGSDPPTVEREVQTVQRAMRRRPDWYAAFVEVPLGRKQVPVAPAPRGDLGLDVEPAPLPLVERHEVADARLRALASVAVAAIEDRIANGAEPASAVTDVVTATFGRGTGRDELDVAPTTTVSDDERVATLMSDPAVVDRVVAAVLDIIGTDGAAGIAGSGQG